MVLAFCVHLTIFVAGAACFLRTNKQHLVFSRPRGGCLHTRTRTHWVTNACDLITRKKVTRVMQPTVLTHQRRVFLFGSNTLRGGIIRKPNHDTVRRARLCLPPCVALCNSRSARTPCVSQPLPSHPVSTVLYTSVFRLLASSAAVAGLSKPKTPRSLGDILPDWGVNKHPALWSGC